MTRQSKYRRERRAEIRRAADEVAGIRAQLQEVYTRFNYTTDPELMEAYIYEINALRARYDYAIRRAKTRLQ